MTVDLPALFDPSIDLIVKVNVSRVEPDYQPGDHVTVRQQQTADAGQIVVALTKESACIVRWPVDDARVLGVVTGMFRSLA